MVIIMNQKSNKNGLIKAFVSIKDELTTHSQIELTSNREAIIQGTKGIIEYSDELIRISLEDFEVQFYGKKLNIECLSQDSLEIKGIIYRIEYV